MLVVILRPAVSGDLFCKINHVILVFSKRRIRRGKSCNASGFLGNFNDLSNKIHKQMAFRERLQYALQL